MNVINIKKESKQKYKNTISSYWGFDVDRTELWAYWENAFSPDECKQIIELGETKVLERGKAGGKIRDVRKSDIVFLYPDTSTEWIFKRFTDLITNLNERFFRFDLAGLGEGLQFTKYSAPGECYGKHIDSGLDLPIRKLSVTLQLSEPDSYEGGDLCLYTGEEPTVISRKQGFFTVFPSYTLHEVKPVTKGVRYSLVAWATGKPFV